MAGKKVVIVTAGTRGDCQPFVALAHRMMATGFDVLLFSNPEHEFLATDFGIPFRPMAVSFKEFVVSDAAIEVCQKNSFLEYIIGLSDHNHKMSQGLGTTYYKLLESFGPDLVICGTGHWNDAIWIPILFPIPAIVMSLSNSHTANPYKSPFGLPSLPFGLNRPVWKLVWKKWCDGLAYMKEIADLSGKPIDEFMPNKDDMMELFASNKPDLFHFCPYLIAQDENLGKMATDTPRHTYVGNFCLDANVCTGKEFGGNTAIALDNFIEACGQEPPIYIGWGSCKWASAKVQTQMAVRTLRLTGRKGIILGGWSELKAEALEGVPDFEELMQYSKANIFFTETAAHETLFPRCALIVHHGGIGTTYAAVKSGRPNVVTPIIYDQFDNAALVVKCGQGSATKQLTKLSAQELADVIMATLRDSTKVKKAAELGAKLQKRDGVTEATNAIIKFMREDLDGGASSKYWRGFNEYAIKKQQKRSSKFSRCGWLPCR